ncbi:pyrimidodiazepine synthase-like [Glandiceps talaboti]
MSIKHLATGAALPPLQEGMLRLFSMTFCPFAQRSRLVLEAKRIPYNLVNCNLKNKPEWLLERNPKGLVPVLEHHGNVIYESLIVNDYLDAVFPDRPLNPKDPYKKAEDQMLVNALDHLVALRIYKVLKTNGTDEKSRTQVFRGLKILESALQKRGSKFFGGDQPGMADYNMWPWFERLKLVDFGITIFGEELPTLTKYVDKMFSEDRAVKNTVTSAELHTKFNNSYFEGNPMYDH